MPVLIRPPLTQTLLISAGLHFAVLALMHPIQGGSTPAPVILNARLQEIQPQAVAPEEALEPELPAVTPASLATAKTVEPEKILTSTTPSPAKINEPPPAVTSSPPPSPPAPTPTTALPPTLTSPTPTPAATESKVLTPALPEIAIPSPIDTNWYLARQVDKHPKPIGSITPVYPESAHRQSLEGQVKLMLKIDDLGRVQDAEVVESTPEGVFDAAALEAFKNARFEPAMRNGKPVRYQAYMRVTFKLD